MKTKTKYKKQKARGAAAVNDTVHAEYFGRLMKDKGFREAYDEEKILMRFAMELQKERERQHITQKQLAKRTGIVQPEISKIEQGTQNVEVKTLIKLAEGVNKKLSVRLI
jgi:DNA-binding XRE family transcriptional regulator